MQMSKHNVTSTKSLSLTDSHLQKIDQNVWSDDFGGRRELRGGKNVIILNNLTNILKVKSKIKYYRWVVFAMFAIDLTCQNV